MKSKGQQSDRLCLRSGVDLTAIGLTPEEGMAAARIGAPMSLQEIGFMMGWSEARTARVVDALLDKGAVIWSRASLAVPVTGDGNIYPTPLMTAECDLNESERKRILWICSQLEEINFYDILDAHPSDDEAAITRKYRERTLEWHPDRWRRNLGPFKPMIEEIFDRVQLARKTLCNPPLRAEHDRKVAHLFRSRADGSGPKRSASRSAARDALRRAEQSERRRRKNPIIKKLAKAKEQAQEALRLEEQGQLVDALRAAQMAVTYDERNPGYKALVDRLAVLAAAERIKEPMRRGRVAESMARWNRAIAEFEHAVKLAMNAPEPKKRLAYNLIMGDKDPKEALHFARKATTDLPEDPEAYFVLGLCYEKSDMRRAALSAFDRAIELKPNYSEAKKRSRRLRWGVGF